MRSWSSTLCAKIVVIPFALFYYMAGSASGQDEGNPLF